MFAPKINPNAKNVRLLILDLEDSVRKGKIKSGDDQKVELMFDRSIGRVKNLVYQDMLISNTHLRLGYTNKNYRIRINARSFFYHLVGVNKNYIGTYSESFTFSISPENYTQRSLQKKLNSIIQDEFIDLNQNNLSITNPQNNNFISPINTIISQSDLFISRNGLLSINSNIEATQNIVEREFKKMKNLFIYKKDPNGNLNTFINLFDNDDPSLVYFGKELFTDEIILSLEIEMPQEKLNVEEPNREVILRSFNKLSLNLGFNIYNTIFYNINSIESDFISSDQARNRIDSIIYEELDNDYDNINIFLINEKIYIIKDSSDYLYFDEVTKFYYFNIFLFSWNKTQRSKVKNTEPDRVINSFPIIIKGHQSINLNVNNAINIVADDTHAKSKLSYYMDKNVDNIIYRVTIPTTTDETYFDRNLNLTNVIEYDGYFTGITLRLLDEEFKPLKYFFGDKCVITLLIELDDEEENKKIKNKK